MCVWVEIEMGKGVLFFEKTHFLKMYGERGGDESGERGRQSVREEA